MNDNLLMKFNQNAKIIFVDCETQNLCLNGQFNLPWQIATIELQGNKIIKENDYLLKWNPILEVSKEAAFITKYNENNIIEHGKDPLECGKKILQDLKNADYIFGHNLLGFDTYVLISFFKKLGLEPYNIAPKVIDTNAIAKGIKLGIKFNRQTDNLLAYQYQMYHNIVRGLKTNLTALGKENEIEHDYDNLHNALIDLKLNIKVWNKLKHQIDI